LVPKLHVPFQLNLLRKFLPSYPPFSCPEIFKRNVNSCIVKDNKVY
jgi:hypothetical protein